MIKRILGFVVACITFAAASAWGQTTQPVGLSGGAPYVRDLPREQLTLENIGRLLQDPCDARRYRAISSLGSGMLMGGWKGTEKEGVALAAKAMGDSCAAVRLEAAKLLELRGKGGAPAIPMLVKALDDAEPLVRAKAVAALHAAGGAGQGVGHLQQMLEAGDQLEVTAAALASLGLGGQKALESGSRSERGLVRVWSSAGLAKIGLEREKNLKVVGAALAGSDEAMVLAACRATEMMGPGSWGLGPLLARHLKHKNAEIRRPAVRAIFEGPANGPGVVEALIAAFDDENIRPDCLAALGHIGPDAKSAVPALLRLIEEDESARYGALLALAEIAPTDSSALPVLIRVLRKTLKTRPDEHVIAAIGPDEHVIAAIGAYGPAAKEAVPDLIAATKVQSTHPYYVFAAIWALGQIGPDARAADRLWEIKGCDEAVKRALLRSGAKDPTTMPAPDARYNGQGLNCDF